MNKKTSILVLAVFGMILSFVASLVGIILNDGGRPYVFTSLGGQAVQIYGGKGLYQNDSVTKAVTFIGFNWANLIVILPLLILGMSLYRRGQIKGQLLLGSIFAYFAYNYLIGVMGNSFNIMFLVWTGLFSIGLFGLIFVLTDIDLSALPGKLETNFPRKSLSVYALALGTFLPILYLAEIITAYATARPPTTLETYTTLELAALEIGLMTPLHLVGGALLWRKKAWGYFLVILLAFVASMTFISLSIAYGLLYFSFQNSSLVDVIRFIIFAVIASGFSLIAFIRVKD
jgi:hypothetical protein